MKDTNRFKTAWIFCSEAITDEDEKTEMYKYIVNSFLKSPIVTDTNKNNVMHQVQKLPNKSIEEEFGTKIMKKQT